MKIIQYKAFVTESHVACYRDISIHSYVIAFFLMARKLSSSTSSHSDMFYVYNFCYVVIGEQLFSFMFTLLY